jgi:hypothetical protein
MPRRARSSVFSAVGARRRRRLEVGGGEVGGKTWAVARVLITTSRSKERRPVVGRVALDEEAVRSAA